MANLPLETGYEGESRVYCTRCGHPNKDDARFCAECGHPLQEDSTLTLSPLEIEEEQQDEFPFPHDQLEAGQALLLVKRGPNAGSTFLLEKDLSTCGRNPDSDVFLDDITVSRRHAEFSRSGDGSFQIRDVGSLNGVYVNGELVEQARLASGDEVQIGKFKLAYFAHGE